MRIRILFMKIVAADTWNNSIFWIARGTKFLLPSSPSPIKQTTKNQVLPGLR